MEPVQQPFHSIGAAPSIPQPLPGTGEPPLVPGAEPATAPPPPPSKSVEYGGRIYSLEVVQQPIRARMCGFGDKDRRPITPPPCIRLSVRDAITKEEIDPSEIDTSSFILTVDLWSADGTREVNLVRHSASSPSISTATSSPFPPPATVVTYANYPQTPYGPQGYPYYPTGSPTYPVGQQQGLQLPRPAVAGMPYPGAGAAPQPPYYSPQQQYYGSSAAPGAATGQVGGQMPGQPAALSPPAPAEYHGLGHIQSALTGMFTRNLIGSLSTNAFQLADPENRLGIWFILQDLSVRTEGSFRLKMNFVNVSVQPPPEPRESAAGEITTHQPPPRLNEGTFPVLATALSDVFNVYSAKKFPGVIESTPLSKCFALQGIKIPIRKDGTRNVRAVSTALAATAIPPTQPHPEGAAGAKLEEEEWPQE